MEFTGTRLYERLSHKWWPTLVEVDRLVRRIHDEAEYTASVYEYIEEGENEKDVVENSLDFFRVAGFSHPPDFTGAQLAEFGPPRHVGSYIYGRGGLWVDVLGSDGGNGTSGQVQKRHSRSATGGTRQHEQPRKYIRGVIHRSTQRRPIHTFLSLVSSHRHVKHQAFSTESLGAPRQSHHLPNHRDWDGNREPSFRHVPQTCFPQHDTL